MDIKLDAGGHTRGSAAYIWHLDAAGERLTRPAGATRRRFEDPALPFLAHSLDVMLLASDKLFTTNTKATPANRGGRIQPVSAMGAVR